MAGFPAEEPRLAQERIQRFQRLGGVDLSRVDRSDPLLTEVEVGTANYKNTVFEFQCSWCGRIERSDQDMAPACTGPSWLDEHPLEPMERKA